MQKEKLNYYDQLHQASRHYDTKLWAIPVIFFGVAGFVLSNFNFDCLVSGRNFALSVVGTTASLLLLVQFAKDYFYQRSIQDRINVLDERDAFPLYSLSEDELENRLKELKGKKIKFDRFKFLLKLPSSTSVIIVMKLFILLNLIFISYLVLSKYVPI